MSWPLRRPPRSPPPSCAATAEGAAGRAEVRVSRRHPLRNHLVNPIVIAVLRSRLHRLLSGNLILVTYRGRRTGRERTIPVMYAEDGDRLVVLVGDAPAKQWWRNLRAGAQVEVRLRGVLQRGHATVVTGDSGDTDALLATYLARFPRAAGAVRGKPQVLVRVDLAGDAQSEAESAAPAVNDR